VLKPENEARPTRSDVNRFRLQFDPALLRDMATHYDYPGERAMIRDVATPAKARGYFTAKEFVALAHWKTGGRSVPLVLQNTAAEMEEATRIALDPKTREPRRAGVLVALTGVGWPMLGTGTDANRRIEPPGFVSGEHDRAHLLGKQLGGSGDLRENLITMYRRPNRGEMRDIEDQVAQAVRACEVVTYSSIPNYGGGSLPVASVTIVAVGDRGFVLLPDPIRNEP
jgi:hypothetical protein